MTYLNLGINIKVAVSIYSNILTKIQRSIDIMVIFSKKGCHGSQTRQTKIPSTCAITLCLMFASRHNGCFYPETYSINVVFIHL